MFDIDNWKEIGATLARNKTRTFLTAFGIFWGTLMLALLMGGSQGFKRLIMANFDGFASNSAIVFPERTTMPYKGYQKGMVWSLTQTDVENIRRLVPEFEVVSPITSRSTVMKYRDKTFSQGQVVCLEPNYQKVVTPEIVKGRFVNDADVAQVSKICVIGENAANNLFGGDDPIGKFVEADNVYYRVVGVVKQRNEINMNGRLEDAMLVPASTGRVSYNMGNRVDYLSLVAKDDCSPTELRPRLYQALRLEHPLHPDDNNNLFFMDISEMFNKGMTMISGIEILILFVGLSSLIAGIIGVGNIMWIIVKERTKEFGIRRALGAKPRTIMSQIMQEGAILTLIAGTAGICAAVGILQIATTILAQNPEIPQGINFQLTFSGAMTIMVLFLVLGSAAGAIPAFKAMRIKPIEALNDK